MTAYLIPTTQQFFDNNGDPLAGGMIYTCIAGASGYTEDYFKDTYTDATGDVANTNPIILDAFGRCNIWGDGTTYKFFIFSASGSLIRADDNMPCIANTATITDGSITYSKLAASVTASSDSVIAGLSSTSFPTPASLSGAGIVPTAPRIGQYGSVAYRNFIDNSNFPVWQRGASVTIASGATGVVVDRYNTGNNAGTSAVTVASDTMTINSFAQPCAKFTNGSAAVSSYSASAYLYPFAQTIEGYTIYSRNLANTIISVSVYMEVSVAGKYAIAFQNATGSYSYVHTTTLAAATPTEVSFTISIPTTSGLWNCPNANTRGAALFIGFVGGTNHQAASTDTWLSGTYYTTSDCVNWGATAGSTIKIARVRIEEGAVLGSYEIMPYNTELSRAQYFLPAWSGQGTPLGVAAASSATAAYLSIPFTHQTRIAPTGITLSAASHINVLLPNSTSISPTSAAFNAASTFGLVAMNLTGLSGLTAGYAYNVYGNTSAFRLLATGAEL